MSDIDDIPAVILAGGASRRMGADKAMLSLGGTPLLAHALTRIGAQTAPIVISRHEAPATLLGAPVVCDASAGFEGPLAGLLAGLSYFTDRTGKATHMLSIAVDTPFFPDDLVKTLSACNPSPSEIIIARSNGRAHPVFALWPLTIAGDLARFIADPQNRRLMRFIERHPHRYADFAMIQTMDEPLDPFFNINTPEQMDKARAIAKMLASPR